MKPIGTAVWVTLLQFGFLQRIIPIALDQLGIERDWLYSKVTGGLTWVGAAAVALSVRRRLGAEGAKGRRDPGSTHTPAPRR